MPCDSDKYDHTCCQKCPKGSRVLSNCNKTSETKCEPCPKGYYLDDDYYADKCFQCGSCSSNNLEISEPCTNESNTKCKCMEGFYCTSTLLQGHCERCKQVRLCPPGEGVSVHHNSTHDTMCRHCPTGTFNNKTDYLTTCQNHTRCSDLGRYLLSEGTAETDAKCGDFIPRCHWMIPASLWAGLILTLILFFIGVMCLRCKKRKRKAVITMGSSQIFVPPALPPDVIKYPRSPEIQTPTHNSKLCTEEYDGPLECDGVEQSVFSEKFGAFSVPDTCMSFISEHYRSEPQEDDWPAL
ncbi:tumor necrosis factor receptor superfamily member 5-like [Tachysurus ichikawai]